MFEKKKGAAHTGSEQGVDDATKRRVERTLCCVTCEHVITTPSARTTISASHEHTFMNPHGYMYRVGCFLRAPGVLPEGMPSDFFSWFPGYTWLIERCGGCGMLMGWCFENAQDHFFGLILPHLVEKESTRES